MQDDNHKTLNKMTTEEIRNIIADEQVSRLTQQFCHHWQVAGERMACLTKELVEGIDTNVEAELYAILMRLQRTFVALMELNKKPFAYLFADSLERIEATLDDTPIRSAVMTLLRAAGAQETTQVQKGSFFDIIGNSLAQLSSPSDQQIVMENREASIAHLIGFIVKYLQPQELMSLIPIIQQMQEDDGTDDKEATEAQMEEMHTAFDEIASRMNSSRLQMGIMLLLTAIIPEVLVEQMKTWRADSIRMAPLVNKVLAQVRSSKTWEHYWEGRRQTLRVVSDNTSWNETLRTELSKEKELLGKVPEGLFAKWATDTTAFTEDFLKAGLDDDGMRNFVFHLACVQELGRELSPLAKNDKEEILRDDRQTIGDAVLDAASKLDDLVEKKWISYYYDMWRELIQNDHIFVRLKVTRKSPHNNLFTARFFCHLVGEMKKSAIFGSHADADLAKKLVKGDAVGTFRKNIQEGFSENEDDARKSFASILLKYKKLANKR